MSRPGRRPHRAEIIPGFQAGDVDAGYLRIAGLGMDRVTPPATLPRGYRSMIVKDPEGNLINVCSAGRAAAG